MDCESRPTRRISSWCKNCVATASDSVATSECGRYCSTTFWARSGHRSSATTPNFACPSALDGELWRHIWKLDQDLFTNAFTPQTGHDKTVQSQIYWGLLKTARECRQLRSHHQQDKTVLSCWCRPCELGITIVVGSLSPGGPYWNYCRMLTFRWIDRTSWK